MNGSIENIRKEIGKFKIDKKRVEACIEHNDYYSAMEYSNIAKDFYKNQYKMYFKNLIKLIKNGEYQKIDSIK